MKKFVSICFSLILLLACFANCFAAEIYEIDSFTGEILNSSTGLATNYVNISPSCTYDKTNRLYIYSTSANNSTNVSCTVCDGMITSNIVSISTEIAAQIEVYRDGKIVDTKEYGNLSRTGTYIVRSVSKDKEIFSFTIVGPKTGKIYSYKVPSAFNIVSAKKDGKDIVTPANTVDMSEEGEYSIQYQSPAAGTAYTLDLVIDHTAPELEIIGVENGIARRAVSFGPREKDSTLTVTMNGQSVDPDEPIKAAGDYTAVYTDDAGNESTYYFTVKVFLDGGAWIFVILALAVIVLAGGYMLRCRKYMRTR